VDNKSIIILLFFLFFPISTNEKIRLNVLFSKKGKSEYKSNDQTAQNDERRRDFCESQEIKSADDYNNIYKTNGVQSGYGNIFYQIKK